MHFKKAIYHRCCECDKPFYIGPLSGHLVATCACKRAAYRSTKAPVVSEKEFYLTQNGGGR